MRKIKEVLRLRFAHSSSIRQIGKSCDIGRTTVSDYIERAERAGLTWPLPVDLDDQAIEALLYPSVNNGILLKRSMPSMDYLYRELKRKSVTLNLLWYEYKQANPDGYQYSRFCELYRGWVKKLDVSLRQEHRAGEKLFIDYAGQTVPIVNRTTGEITQAQIFLAVLGASNYTYAEAAPSQELPFWIKSHVRAFKFFGGVPQILVPDNLKSGVTHPCRYEPDINPTYQDLAEHYGTVVIPARSRKPKDKAKAEVGVLIVERWILAAIRNHTFFSIAELNKEISQRLPDLNNRKFQKLDNTRRSLFLTVDQPALQAIPSSAYEYAEWKKARVNVDYHVDIFRHYYSVPFQLAKEQVDARVTDSTVEILFKIRRVASHVRKFQEGGFATLPEHMPKSHQKHLEWTPSRIINWAGKNGPRTQKLVSHILENKPHPEQGFRSCLGIMRLAKQYSPERLEAACDRALAIKGYSYKNVKSILRVFGGHNICAAGQGREIKWVGIPFRKVSQPPDSESLEG